MSGASWLQNAASVRENVVGGVRVHRLVVVLEQATDVIGVQMGDKYCLDLLRTDPGRDEVRPQLTGAQDTVTTGRR